MARYRKKPIEIDAIQYTAERGDLEAIGMWCGEAPMHPGTAIKCDAGTLEIVTLEGTMTVSPGDWIIRGVKGEIYPCKPDIFAATYDEVV